MAALTWRNIDAPDFRASMEGYSRFSELLGDSIGNLQRGVNTFEREQDKQQEAAFQRETAKYGSAELLAQALQQDPTLGLKADRISPQALDAAQGRVNMLMGREDARLGIIDKTADIENDAYVRGRAKDVNVVNDALKPIFGQAQAAFAENTPEGRARGKAILAGNQELISKADPATQATLFGLDIDYQKQNLGLSSDILRNEQANFEFTNAKEAFAQDKKAQDIFANIQQDPSVSSAAAAIASLNTLGLTDGAQYNKVRAAIIANYGGGGNEYAQTTVEGAVPTGGGGGGANRSYRGGSAYNAVLGDGKFGLPGKPVTEMTMGEVYEFGRSTLIPNSKKAGVGKDSRGVLGSSAAGAYQFTGETLAGNSKNPGLAKELYGDNWRNVKFTPAVQDAMAEVLFNRNKNGNLKKTWEGLPDARRGAYANKTWAEMRQIILKNEVGDSGPARNTTQIGSDFKPVSTAEIARVKTILTKGDAVNPRNPALRSFAPLAGVDTSAQAEGNRLSKLNKAIPADRFRDVIAATAKKFGVNEAIAGRMVERSIKTDRSSILGLTPAIGNKGTYIDAKLLDEQGALFQGKGMGAIKAAGVLSQAETQSAAVNSALKTAQSATARLQKARIAKQNNPSLDISGAIADKNQADVLLRQAVDGAEEFGNSRLPKNKKTAVTGSKPKPKPAPAKPKRIAVQKDAGYGWVGDVFGLN